MKISTLFFFSACGVSVASPVNADTKDLAPPQLLNASIAEILGYEYVEALDYSALWFGVSEVAAKEINNLQLTPEAHPNEVADTILRLVYGGDYVYVPTSEIDQLLGEVQQELTQIDQKWEGRLVEDAGASTAKVSADVAVPPNASLNKRYNAICDGRHKVKVEKCKGFFDDLALGHITFKTDYPTPRSVCMAAKWPAPKCCLSWLKNVHISPGFFNDGWQECRANCFDREKVSCRVPGVQSHFNSDERAAICWSDRPEGCH